MGVIAIAVMKATEVFGLALSGAALTIPAQLWLGAIVWKHRMLQPRLAAAT
jgi:hypothetical protein